MFKYIVQGKINEVKEIPALLLSYQPTLTHMSSFKLLYNL
jgi:hypothetical protein